MYGISEYVIALQEAEKTRLLACQTRKERSSPTGSPPESRKGVSEVEKAMSPGTMGDS